MKRIFLLLFACCMVHLSFGQIRFELTAGVTSPEVSIERKTSWYVGGYSCLPIITKWQLNAGLLYSSQQTTDARGYAGQAKEFYQFHFLHLPISLSYHPIAHLGLSIGPELSYLLSANWFEKYGPQYNVTKTATRLTTGIDGAIQYTIKDKVGVLVNYYYGFKHKEEYKISHNQELINTNYYLHNQFRLGVCYSL